MSDTVVMTHPDLPDAPPATATRRQYDLVWSGLGWRTESPEQPAPEPAPGTEPGDPASRRKTTTTPAAPAPAAPSKES